MVIKSIRSRAPTRIDLAGGTLDIWPLYLFLNGPLTINLGIDLYAEATIDLALASGSQPGKIRLKSQDQNAELEWTWEDLARGAEAPPALSLHAKLLRFFFERRRNAGHMDLGLDLTLTTRANSPAGAGLGGSSTLSVAMIGALASWAEETGRVDFLTQGEKFIEIVRDIETTVIRVPAGLQDYYGAMFGGLQALRWGTGSQHREWLPAHLIAQLDERILLFYSGQSRNSGINNWALFKSFIDQKDDVREKFKQISQATHHLEAALRAKDWIRVGAAISEEWTIRKTLAPGITTPDIDQAFSEAQKTGPISGKICGAGGGGCFFVYLPTAEGREKQKEEIEKVFAAQGVRRLPFKGVPHGLEVQVTRA